MENNIIIPSSLIEKIKNKKVVLFIGSGLSSNAGLPNWSNLLIELLNGISQREPRYHGYIDSLEKKLFEPIEILKKIEVHKTYIIEEFEKIMKKYNEVDPTTIHKKISQISTKIITTNYDELIEKSDSRLEKITYYNNYKTAKIHEYENYVYKIHGDINEPDKCVLFPSQYEEIYGSNETLNVFDLKKIISEKTILFIGFSMSDPYVDYVFKYVDNLLSGFKPESFIITTDRSTVFSNRVTKILLDSYENLERTIDSIIESSKVIDIKDDISELSIIDSLDDSVIEINENLEYDLPPNIKHWVGRKKEIENISNDNFKVIFITGIGGQGKSALAAKFVKNYFNNDLYEFGDWRDFKEETNRFQTKFISIIKRLTNHKIDISNYESCTNKELVDVFFQFLGERRIVFVFDNIDSYIDLVDFVPTGDLGYLYNQCMNKNHNSKFIFTCRPFIKEAGIDFYQIKLSGLSISESLELFKAYNINIKNEKLETFNAKAHKITKGHPLWLNLIAAQAIRGIDNGSLFLDKIENKSNFDEEDFSSIISQKILKEVWETLNPKQRILLCGIAETVRPENENNLKMILESKLNSNQFNRAFNTLKNLNLIEIKSSSISDDQVELHPLVKEFIINKYPRVERAKYITLLVKYYDNFIYILKPKLNSKLSLSSFQNWTSKIELEVNKGDYKPALIALQEVSSPILTAGFSEEYVRVSQKLYDSIVWKKAIDEEYPYFHIQLFKLTTILIQLDKSEIADEYLEKYEKLINGKSSHYLAYCSEKCYMYWFKGQFEEAINYGEKGEFLLLNSGLTDNYSLKFNLALSRRDTKENDKIKLALNYFLSGEEYDIVVNKKNIKSELGGHFYGNIGRCLDFMSLDSDALVCYYKSMKLLFDEDTEYSKINLGYASFWISEVLLKNKQIFEGLMFLKFAKINWENTAIPRFRMANNKWSNTICDKETKLEINKKLDWELEKYCRSIISSNLK